MERLQQRFFLENDHKELTLRDKDQIFSNTTINFNQMNHDWAFRHIGKKHDLCKATGLRTLKSPTVLDATAGLARDSFIFLKMGCDVTLCERHPLLAEMLAHAIANFEDQNLKKHLHFQQEDALDFLKQCASFDIVYLDPMFPETNSSALVKKDMQILQELIGSDKDSAQLLELALKKARKRVVVKRHKGSPFLAEKTPTHSIKGKTTRYDVYCLATACRQ